MKISQLNDGLTRELFCWDGFFYSSTNDRDKLHRKYLNNRLDTNFSIGNLVKSAMDPNEQVYNILDVGSGPLPFLGRKWDNKVLNIICVDLLAEEYYKLYKKYRIYPPNIPIKCDIESLSDMFPDNYFDLVYARNSIDHTQNPLKCIKEMMVVSKKTILLEHTLNEGLKEQYDGLHQWNFNMKNENFIIGDKNGVETVVNNVLTNVSICCNIGVEEEEGHDNWLSVIIKKL
jgi:hypothetical protein